MCLLSAEEAAKLDWVFVIGSLPASVGAESSQPSATNPSDREESYPGKAKTIFPVGFCVLHLALVE